MHTVNLPENITQELRKATTISLPAPEAHDTSWLSSLPSAKEVGSAASFRPSRSATWLQMLDDGIPDYRVGESVLSHCLSSPSTRALVFFSLDDALIARLLEALAAVPNFQVVFAANLQLTPIGCENLISLCYGEKPFFNERARTKMARERFVFSKNAFIVVFSYSKDPEKIKTLKLQLRSLLPGLSFERRIHGTDKSEDTEILVEAITNPNTVALLNKVRISRHDRVLTRVPEEMRGDPNICLDGSSVMELFGLRKSRDLDFICAGDAAREKILSLGFDVNNGHYSFLPIKSDEVIKDPFLHIRLYGIKFTSLEVRYLILRFGIVSQIRSLSSKKRRDFHLITKYLSDKGSSSISLSGIIGTVATQFRLLFELTVAKFGPKLPEPLLRLARRIWSLRKKLY